MGEMDGSVTNWSYDAAGRLLTDQKLDGEANVVYGNTYVYDALGNRTSQTDLNGVTRGTIQRCFESVKKRDGTGSVRKGTQVRMGLCPQRLPLKRPRVG